LVFHHFCAFVVEDSNDGLDVETSLDHCLVIAYSSTFRTRLNSASTCDLHSPSNLTQRPSRSSAAPRTAQMPHHRLPAPLIHVSA
jgi:hypothetical protein